MWNTIENGERLRLWKKLRDDLVGKSLENKMAEVAKFCARMPYGSRTLDYYSPEDWPTPWEILFHGSFCTSSISLLMFHTFALSDIEESLDLYLVEDDEGVFLLPVIANHFVLNYHLGMESNYPEINVNNVPSLKS
jgi:hypothetical protein